MKHINKNIKLKKMKLLNLFFAITLPIVTICIIGLSFAILSPTIVNMYIICILSLVGFGGAYIYYLNYKEIN